MYITKEFLQHFITNIENKIYKEKYLNIDYWLRNDELPKVSAQDICEFIDQIQQSDLDIILNQ